MGNRVKLNFFGSCTTGAIWISENYLSQVTEKSVVEDDTKIGRTLLLVRGAEQKTQGFMRHPCRSPGKFSASSAEIHLPNNFSFYASRRRPIAEFQEILPRPPFPKFPNTCRRSSDLP
jgi:hypothetical protein